MSKKILACFLPTRAETTCYTMKNSILLLFISFLSTAAFAESYSITVHVSSAYHSEPITNVKVELTNAYGNKLLQSAWTDEQGVVTFTEVRRRTFALIITSPNGLYLSIDTLRWRNVNKTDLSFEKMLFPSKRREMEIISLEDSIYGSDKVPIDDYKRFSSYEYLKTEVAHLPNSYSGSRYLKENLRYPKNSYEEDIMGKTYVTFIVEKDGKTSHIDIRKPISPDIDAEIRRVLRGMPDWIPAKINGVNVRSWVGVPIEFKIWL